MSWNNVIPNDLLWDIINSLPKQYHLDLDCPPIYTIKEEYFTSINTDFSWITSEGSKGGVLAHHVDHPAFTALRDHLAGREYIHKETGWVNGDRVLKPFILNGVLFKVGRQFPSATAMAGRIASIKKYGDYD